ncbi:response regulator transcription factor [Cohnella herbarum]|uniref:Response regulator n=1 Tax=Cohnella herbarum TaxID=2728023 RepID=A0A7Z2VKH8_9BACL|nr:response regulator [Cohnella herbarum]QJD84717.1 response regulator [Cohnella herbarum]
MKLLIVDDQVSLHRYLNKVMSWRDMGFTKVEHAYDGEEAAGMVDTFRPDIMIMDIHMPLLNGIESLKRIQQSGNLPRTIILSAYDQFEYARDALRLQVSHYLLKPVDADQLRDVLGELIRESESAVRQSIRSELNGIIYSGVIEAESLSIVRKGLEFLAVDRFAILTFTDSLPSESDYICWLQEQAVYKFRCVICCKNRKDQIVLVGGGDDLSNGQLRELSEFVMEKAAALSPTHTLSAGISSIAQDVALLPQLLAESAQAMWEPAETGSRLQDAVWRIKPYVDSSYQEDLSLQSVASRFNIDKYQLSRAFKQEFGVNYWAYVIKVRMDRAAELLVGTNWKNSRIAEHTGFLEESHFSRAFKKYYGVTPKEYRASSVRLD